MVESDEYVEELKKSHLIITHTFVTIQKSKLYIKKNYRRSNLLLKRIFNHQQTFSLYYFRFLG